MGTPSATPSGPSGWVRGPKSPRPAGPAPHGAPAGTAPVAAPEPDGHAAAAPAAAPGSAPAPAPGVTTTAPAPAPHSGTVTTTVAPAPAAPVRAAAPAHVSPPAAPARRTAPASAAEPSWGEPRRGATGRGGSRGEVGWVQAHGGAGATSLAEALGGVDLGVRWPQPSRGEPRRILLVGRTSAGGLRSVSQALGALKEGNAPQGLDLLCVVLVADAPGRLPLRLLRRIRVLRSAAHVHRVPWIPAWRLGGSPKSPPRQLVSLGELVAGAGRREETAS
ncbi:hypothetical protein [Streptomyces sp. NPDC000983]|uniref:hypothetical protein n=1 Tax=Streptomyces sp. NPDC000983 TaxID=3154373 RepID=UPI00331D3121